ncbi:expressed unknown protein [Seminavis robusta]|uniref:C2H2-type domain-containing protein n=1 Tax=Seminavis robusta TaxID=568900 RepID=A0A9N8EQ71_9STRA|nr:expressed unknown protein [Seminavis robusta]|eukprot:Sro1758_g295770.1 n/a (887) ;mRNA; r:15106-18497
MSSRSTQKAGKRQEKIRRKASLQLSKLQASTKDEARDAATNVAELFTRGWKFSNFSLPEAMLPSYDADANSKSSKEAVGIESAVKRGLQKGSSERNERINTEGVFRDDASDFDLTTITEDVLTNISGDTQSQKRSKDKKKQKDGGKKKKKSTLDMLSKELTHDAWMCGVCGKAFSSLAAADKHEERHIQDIVLGLGWGVDNRNYFTGGASGYFSSNESVASSRYGTGSTHRVTFGNDPRMETHSTTSDGIDPVRQMHTAGAGGLDPLFGDRYDEDQDESLLLSNNMKQAIVLADEALVNVCEKAEKLVLTEAEREAERELMLLSKDKSYYDLISERTLNRKRNPASRFRSEGKTVLSKVQNKFVDAYQLMKEGDQGLSSDQYNRKRTGQDDTDHVLSHDDTTLYVNVMVRNSIQVVSHELERLAKRRWEDANSKDHGGNRFERFRALAHGNLVKLAGLALASDFTPRRIAVQLSNDLYRLLKPKMKRRGVTIETEIEYRIGPYFVLAVNILSIDWGRLIVATKKDVVIRESRWQAMQRRKALEEGAEANADAEESRWRKRWEMFCHFTRMTRFDMIAQVLSWLHYCHWIIYWPVCTFYYYTFMGSTIRSFIISSVTDEIFFYVEEKGMEMEIEVKKAKRQAAFMLSALREIRADDRALKKKQQESDSADKGTILGPLLGPAIKQDKDAPVIPPGFEIPENLEDVGLELDLPVGFRRLRWALLSSTSEFLKEAVFRTECNYDDLTFGSWSKHDENIGAVETPPGVDPADFLGAEKETSYLMPKSAFVSANMCYETNRIAAYNDYVFCLKKEALTPDVPYGKTFKAWTQFLVINTGNNTCRLICSVEAEFPNGPPLVSRQIKSGMRAGTGEIFVKVGETISKYADEYP